MALLNRSSSAKKMDMRWTELGYPQALQLKIRDLWEHADKGKVSSTYSAEVASHGVVFLRLTP